MAKTKAEAANAQWRGWTALMVDGSVGAAGVVEQMHATILDAMGPFSPVAKFVTGSATTAVYRGVRSGMRGVGGLADMALRLAGRPARLGEGAEKARAVVNGVLGDHLVATANPLALPMTLRRTDNAPTGRLLVLVHGLCMNDRSWTRRGHDHGDQLARDQGWSPLYLSYNSGEHISTNGRALATVLEELVATWPLPIERLAIVGHSMGGLVARSACYYGDAAGHAWVKRLDTLVFLGSPHLGAPLERIGHWIDGVVGGLPLLAPFVRLGRARSAGIADLRHGHLREEDQRAGADRAPVRLPTGVDCFAVAATTADRAGSLKARLICDGLVPIDSALGRHADPRRDLAFPPANTWIGTGMGHFDLLDRRAVYDRIAGWLGRGRPVALAGRRQRSTPRRPV
jgi:pimeloyl-ACP methyl ester carboxylesterase